MPIIGIITRKSISDENHDINIIYEEIENSISTNGGIPIGITLCNNYKDLIQLCDGIIFQGGDNFEEYDIEVLRYLYDNNIPTLGICLGMQLMGYLFEGKLININNHKKNLSYSHSIYIKDNTKLYDIYKENVIKVNSRHKSVIIDTKLVISAVSNDGYIEALEDPNKKFFIGVQWHPESMIGYNKAQNKIFKYFINICKSPS